VDRPRRPDPSTGTHRRGRAEEMWREQPGVFVALVALATTAALLLTILQLYIAIIFWTISFIATLGVKVAQWTQPLRPDQVALIAGRIGSRVDKIVWRGRMMLMPGQISTIISLRWRHVPFEVECRSGDEVPVPVTIALRAAFRVPRVEDAIRVVAEEFGDNHDGMREAVVACLVSEVRDVVGGCPAEQVDRAAGSIAEEAMRRAAPKIVAMGFEPGQLTVTTVELSPEWRDELAKRIATQARSGTVDAELAIEDHISRAAVERRNRELVEAEKAKADANLYSQLRQVELARAHMQLEREKQALEREHLTAMAELEFYKLREKLGIESGYHEERIQRMIVERLPQILEAKGKLLPNLRTYIAGQHDNGLIGLMAGLAEFGPDIMQELKGFVRSLSATERTPLPDGDGREPALTPIPDARGRRQPHRVDETVPTPLEDLLEE
jgi:SPFH domain / Band 7 family